MGQRPPGEWRPIPAYESFYEICEFGRIWNLRRRRLLQTGREVMGYLRADLRKRGRRSARRVHCLVALVFIGPRPPRHDVNHIDGNKLNNHRRNLEYVSRRANNRHAWAMGLQRPGQNRRLPLAAVHAIRGHLEVGVTRMARYLHVAPSTITMIRNGTRRAGS